MIEEFKSALFEVLIQTEIDTIADPFWNVMLLKALSHANPKVRHIAIGFTESPKLLEAVVRTDADENNRLLAFEKLQALLGDAAVMPLLKLEHDNQTFIYMLGKMGKTGDAI